ncbi:MAG TPA: NnrS family protein, partial [Denitromonas sp.]|nr:NnrS family protein [Denitromonas sp.]
MAIIRLEEPRPRLPASRAGWSPFMAMAFRPFYLFAALFGVVAILAWVAGFNGTDALPGLMWHGHEMIWGYAGAVIVGFLLTAVGSWTGQPAFSGTPLAGLDRDRLCDRLVAGHGDLEDVLAGRHTVGLRERPAARGAVLRQERRGKTRQHA